MKLKVAIVTLKHEEQRYPTVGDWFYHVNGDELKITIFVSEMSDVRYVFLVAMHELYECFACYLAGISEEIVTKFDVEFEEERKAGRHKLFAEPGDSENAPYHIQHVRATDHEKQMSLDFGVDWTTYETEVNSL